VTQPPADSSAKQFGPCTHGTGELADLLDRITTGRPRRGDVRRAHEVVNDLYRRGACALPDAAAGLAATALEVFAEDVERHASGAPCEAASRGMSLLPVPDATTGTDGGAE
jgi:NADH:ubiquinone oxidoreductase subunit F (NADH-binding)